MHLAQWCATVDDFDKYEYFNSKRFLFKEGMRRTKYVEYFYEFDMNKNHLQSEPLPKESRIKNPSLSQRKRVHKISTAASLLVEMTPDEYEKI